jgi:hypothetical protein
VLDFIKKVNFYSKAHNVSREDLFTSCYHLFEDVGQLWYEANIPYCSSWIELKDLLKLHFLPQDYEYELKKEILNRKQSEPFTLYHGKMEQLFQNCPLEFNEQEKLRVLHKNFDFEYHKNLLRFRPKTIQELTLVCKEIEELLGEDFWKKKLNVANSEIVSHIEPIQKCETSARLVEPPETLKFEKVRRKALTC